MQSESDGPHPPGCTVLSRFGARDIFQSQRKSSPDAQRIDMQCKRVGRDGDWQSFSIISTRKSWQRCPSVSCMENVLRYHFPFIWQQGSWILRFTCRRDSLVAMHTEQVFRTFSLYNGNFLRKLFAFMRRLWHND